MASPQRNQDVEMGSANEVPSQNSAFRSQQSGRAGSALRSQRSPRSEMSGSALNSGLKRQRLLDAEAASPASPYEIGSNMQSPQSGELGSQSNLDIDDWNLRNEKLTDEEMPPRLVEKIINNFKHFIDNFTVEVDPKAQGKKRQDGDDDEIPDNKFYAQRLRKMCEDGKRSFVVNFQHMYSSNEYSVLAWWMSQFPARILPILCQAATQKCLDWSDAFARGGERRAVYVQFDRFPVADPIRKLRNDNLNMFITCEAVVTKRTLNYNQLKDLYLNCEQCGQVMGPYQPGNSNENMFANRCCPNPGCQSRSGFTLNTEQSTYENYQRITIQEPPGTVLAGRMPRSKEAILHGEMVDSVRPGDLVTVTGIYQAAYDAELNATTSFPVFKTEIRVNYICKKHDDQALQLTNEEIAHIQRLSTEVDIRERIIQSLAPSIHGEPHIKTAIALSMFGGQPKIAPGGHRIRGDLNVLVLGDPGMAKSQFLKYVEKSFPRAIYTTGKGASAVGLTAAVGRDPMSGEWLLEGGAMVLADQGICLIDEFDKMNDQDRTSIHEAMEQQTISIAKAGICASLQARCSVIAAANPKYGRYDSQLPFNQNVDLTDPILSRFDILCVLKDTPDSGRDDRLADFVVCSHMKSHPDMDEKTRAKIKVKGNAFRSTIEPLDQETLMNYIRYARQRVKPQVTDMDREKLARFYQEIRRESKGSGGNNMTVRHVESMVRIAEANARIELRPKVNSRDVDHAIAIMLESFCQTQKHIYAQELRKKFQHYILAVQDHYVQLTGLLSQQMTRAEIFAANCRSGAEVDPGSVFVPEKDFIREARQFKLEQSVPKFILSDMFKESFVYDATAKSIRRLTDEERFAAPDEDKVFTP